MRKRLDLKGQKFGRLSVGELSHISKHGESVYECLCDCGTKINISAHRLKNSTRSCGCLRHEKRPRHKMLSPEVSGLNVLYDKYIRGAKKRSLEFTLSKEEFNELRNKNCYYCNLPPSSELSLLRNRGQTFKYNGIDRVDNNLGYILGNCVPCCKWCNISKGTNSLDDWKKWIKNLYTNMYREESCSSPII